MENELQNSEEYINKKNGKTPGFAVPSNYFGTIEDAIDIKLIENNFPKEKGFKVPDAYFEKLENTILSKVPSTKKEIKVISLQQRLIKIIPITAAACVLLFFGLNSFIFNTTEDISFDKLADSEIENWITNNINLINYSDLAYTYNDIEFEEHEIIPSSISDNELENYLSNQEDISLLLENE